MESELEPQDHSAVQPGKIRSFFSRHALALGILGATLLLVIGIVLGAAINLVSTIYATKYLVKSGLLAGAGNAASLQAAPVVPIEVKPGAPVMGDPNAKVTIVEFGDYQCPFCHEFFTALFPQLKREYIDTGKVKFVYQDFAFLGDESKAAGEAAKCAQDQNKFWEYHDYLFNHQDGENKGAFTVPKLKQFARALQLDTGKFSACLDTHAKQAEDQQETDSGIGYGIQATPTLFINGHKYEGVGTISLLKQAIDQATKDN